MLNWPRLLPDEIEIEVTTRCHLKCRMCEHSYWQEPGIDMTFAQFKGILDQLPTLRWIGLTGIGESFLNPDWLKMLHYVKARGACIELYDNYCLIEGEAAREMVSLGIDRIFASLDAASKPVYEALRVGSNFERVIANVEALARLKRGSHSLKPGIPLHFILNKANIHEMSDFFRLARDLAPGVAGPHDAAVQLTRMLHPFPEAADLYCELPEGFREWAEADAKKFGVALWWNLDTRAPRPPMRECAEHRQPFVFATGHVIPCCAANEANGRERQKATAMGNAFEEPLAAIWNGPGYRRLRQMLKANQVPEQCQHCCLYALP